MPKLQPIQQSFSAGEISADLLSRTDLPGYEHSAIEMTNMVPLIQGPARSRNGFEFIAKAISNEQYCRMLSFYYSFAESFAIVITETFVYILDRNGLQPTDNEIQNPNFNDGPLFWNVTEEGGADVQFLLGVASLEGGANANRAMIDQTITIPAGDEAKDHKLRIKALGIGALNIKLGTTPGGGELVDEVLNGRTGFYEIIPNVNTVYLSLYTDNGIHKYVDSTALWAVEEGDSPYVSFPSVWLSEIAIEQIQFDMEPGAGRMIITSRSAPTQVLEYFGGGVWTLDPYVVAGQPELDMTEGNRPGCVSFYKGRLYFAGTVLNVETVWASKPRAYEDFTPGSSDQDDDALNLPMDQAGSIEWLRKGKALMVGLDTSEHIIFGGSPQNILAPTPGNVDTEQQSAYGSARVQAIAVGEQIAFITPDRRRVYIATYARTSLGWVSIDITFPAQHVTEARLREIELVRHPQTRLWFPRLDGKLVSMTYDSTKKITAWSQHETQGFVVSICALAKRGETELWAAVLRNGILHFERSDEFQFMDSFTVVSNDPAIDYFLGYDHLIGYTCQVVADGAVHPDVVVDESGGVQLQYPAEVCVVGLQYNARLRTLPISQTSGNQSNTSDMKSWNKIFVRLIDSVRPLINGTRPPERTEETPMGLREPSRTEDVEVANLGWDLYGIVTVEQDLPLPLKVAGVFGELVADKI